MAAEAEVIRPGQLAAEIDRHVDTLKRWDREGLLPAKRDSQGWTYYTRDQVPIAKELAARRAAREATTQ